MVIKERNSLFPAPSENHDDLIDALSSIRGATKKALNRLVEITAVSVPHFNETSMGCMVMAAIEAEPSFIRWWQVISISQCCTPRI